MIIGEKRDPNRPKVPGTDAVYYTDVKKENNNNAEISLYDNGKFVGDVSINEDVYKLHVSSTESREVVGYYSKENHAWHFKTSPSSKYDESKNKEYSKFFNSMRAFHNSKDMSRKAAQTFSIGKVQREL